MRRVLVAIDGPAGAGKSTVARRLAERLGFTYLDTGAMFRCVALARLRDAAADPAALAIDFGPAGEVRLDGVAVGPEIRSPEVTQEASRVAAEPAVRQVLLRLQRSVTADGDWVAEGRDIGTVVRPDAEVKVFLTASEDERARRRARQTGEALAAVLEAQRERDARDRDREVAPLRPADGAIELDTTGLELDEVLDRIVAVALAPRGTPERDEVSAGGGEPGSAGP